MIPARPAPQEKPALNPRAVRKAAGSFHRFPRCPCALLSANSALDAPAQCRKSSPASRAPPVSACSSRCRTARRTCSRSARAPNPASAKSNSIAKATARGVAPSLLPLAPQPAAPFPSRLLQLFAAIPLPPGPAPPALPLPAPPAAAAEPPRALARLPAFAELHLAGPAPLPASCAALLPLPFPPRHAPDPLPAGASLLRLHPRGPSPRVPAQLSFPLPPWPAHLPRPSASQPSRALPLLSPPLRAPPHPPTFY